VVLAGGIGAAKLIEGLVRLVDEQELTIITNTADDFELYGLHISPDLDIVTYTLAGIVNREKGWGMANDTFNFLAMAEKYGLPSWFKIGDMDLATHMFRTQMMSEGKSLTDATQMICRRLGLRCTILPMTNDKVECRVRTATEEMHFEEYYVKRQSGDPIEAVIYRGFDRAKPAPGVIAALETADGIIVAPSNPIVSIGTILKVKGVREALGRVRAKTLAISPIVGGAAIKGPADKMMAAMGVEVSALGVASLYRDFIDTMVIDRVDAYLSDRIRDLGLEVIVTNAVMSTLEDKVALAESALRGVSRG